MSTTPTPTRTSTTREVSTFACTLPGARVTLVGAWVWVTFPSKPDDATRAALKEAGFHWNHKRQTWQHPCGIFRPHAPYDPRTKYATEEVN